MKKKILTVIGARPQIIKAAAVSRAIAGEFSDRIEEIIVHTGQHYDHNMSEVFFQELNIPRPAHNLEVGSASHAAQTAAMITGLEKIMGQHSPDAVLIYGDTNSTLAAAVTASKLGIDVIHVEAGLRSFNKRMPEEINRITADHVSTLLFAPTHTAIRNLEREGFAMNNDGPYSIDNPLVMHCGDVMFDNALHFRAVAEKRSTIINDLGLKENAFVLATIHRDNNTDDISRLTSIIEGLLLLGEEQKLDIVLPLHPRTAARLGHSDSGALKKTIAASSFLKIIAPVSYLDMIMLESRCRIIATDSGGVQKESFFFKKPCIILRPETEWVELVECGAAIIADADSQRIQDAYQALMTGIPSSWPHLFGDGHAAEFICNKILQYSR